MQPWVSSVAAHAVPAGRRTVTLPFRTTHFALPLAACVALTLLFASTSIDVSLAHAWAYDDALQLWLGRRRWWVEVLLHRGGRDAMMLVIARTARHARNGFHLGARTRRASDRGIRARHDDARLGAGRWLEAGHECGVPVGSAGLRRHAPPYRSARYTTTWLRASGLLPRRTLGIRIFAFRFLFRIQGPSTPGSQGGALARAGHRNRICTWSGSTRCAFPVPRRLQRVHRLVRRIGDVFGAAVCRSKTAVDGISQAPLRGLTGLVTSFLVDLVLWTECRPTSWCR